MSCKRPRKIDGALDDLDDSWQEEIERLKHEIKRAETRIFMSEQGKLAENAEFAKECDRQDNEYVKSPTPSDVYSSPLVERVIRGRKLSVQSVDPHLKSRIRRKPVHVSAKEISKEAVGGNWVSPSTSKARPAARQVFLDPFSNCAESSFDVDCGSSVISLDFGLVSPNKNWCSPPQRIERAQNREWSSPHRVIDRPNPENSPGNWISMKESCAALRHSPTLGVKNQPVKPSPFNCPEPESRPVSQSTYVLREKEISEELFDCPKDNPPTRKISVLENYEPERVICTKKRSGDPNDVIERNLLPTNEKVRKVVIPSGHAVKISLLDDFEAPVFGRTHEKTSEAAENECAEPLERVAKGTTKAETSTKLSQSALKSQTKKKREEPKKEDGSGAGIQSFDDAEIHLNKNEEEEKTKRKEKRENVETGAHKIMHNLEEILRSTKEDTDKAVALSKNSKTKAEKWKTRKFKSDGDPAEGKSLEVPEKRKRGVDPKAVREYIRSQKQKRMEQVKMEKKTKDAEKEARKKKLEELRIKTLKLASQSKKKKSPHPSTKVSGARSEDDVTMSLGLKQVIPKVSYNESVSKLRKKIVLQKSQLAPVELQPDEKINVISEGEEDGGEETQQQIEISEPEVNQTDDSGSRKHEESIDLKTESDLNVTLKKLAESLHFKLDQREKEIRSRPVSLASKSAKEPSSQVSSRETSRTVKSTPEERRQLITVDMEAIKTLKSDIKKISENFKVLHEIIAEKGDLSGRGSFKQRPPTGRSEPPKSQPREESRDIPNWLKSLMPNAYPYNVYSAFQKKMKLKTTKPVSSVSQESCTFAEPFSNKCESEFEGLSVPSDRLRSAKEIVGSLGSTSRGTYEENYFSMKDDSGSELSSSILDSEKQSLTNVHVNKRHFSNSSSKRAGPKDSLSSSIVTEITSKSAQVTESKAVDVVSSKASWSRLESRRDCFILTTPDVKLITNDVQQEKPNGLAKDVGLHKNVSLSEELNNSGKSHKEKTDSSIAELLDNLSENERSARSNNHEGTRDLDRGAEEAHVRKSFFQPEMLHLQFQAELTLLETFQRSLSHFLEAERTKAHSESNKIVSEKAINTEKLLDREDRAVQASYLKESSSKTTPEETDSVETEINAVESVGGDQHDLSTKEQDLVSETSKKLNETLKGDKPKDLENSDFSSDQTRVSLQMFNSTMKEEELRSEHLLAFIRLREKTLNEKVKAELTFLEMKKRTLKERGGDEEQKISAIKKKQRGILLKYQSEKEEIERLKKLHKVASEERKTAIKRHKQIQQMQFPDSDMIIRLKKREKSPQKKVPLKPKALNFDSQPEIPEDIPVVSDSLLSESLYSADESRHSSRSDLELSSRSNFSKDKEILKPISKTVGGKIFSNAENFMSKKSQLEVERHPRKQHSIEELLSWTKHLEEKENHLKELEKQAVCAAIKVKSRLVKSLKNAKTSTKDRSTSPFQFQDAVKTTSEASPPEAAEAKKSTTISEVIEANSTSEVTEKMECTADKFQSSASEDIPEQLSNKILTSRTTEYHSESFESPSSSEAPKNKPEAVQKCEWGHKGVAIKMSLSPRMQSPRRRYSSGSDDSVNLSYTETASEQSDLESRIAALHEQLRKRKLEAERLRREQKKAQRERLRVKEQCLLNQIQAYDAYIQKKKQELEREYEHSNQSVMKPLIKQPKVAEKRRGGLVPTKRSERDQPVQHTRPEPKTVEKEESSRADRTPDKESESEAVEQIKVTSESIEEVGDEFDSIKEQIGSKAEEEEKSKKTEDNLVPRNYSIEESFDGGKSASISESIPEQDAQERSQSESEDQSISIKTTLQSPEKQDTDLIETLTGVEETSQNRQTTDEDFYQFDSFESDADEKVTVESDIVQKLSEPSEGSAEVKSESAVNEDDENVNVDAVSREEEDAEESAGNSKKAEKIADSIVMALILESVNVFCSKKAEAEKRLAEESRLSLESLSGSLAREIISEAVDDMIRIYNRKARPEREGTPGRVTSEVGRRFTEVMSETGAVRDQRTSQDVMITIYDVSRPEEEAAPGEGPERDRFLQSLSLFKREKPEEQILTVEESNGDDSKPETLGQEWIDEDFGLSQTRKEAEELRLQQLQIEQEIQQLQAQQKQVPYFYLREIPNKPPPPYTPPAKPFAEIPASESEILRITQSAVRILTDEMSKGKRVADIEPDWEYYGDTTSENFKCFKFFLFDLAKLIVSDLIMQQEMKAQVLPWMRTRKRLDKYKYQRVERTFACLNDFVQRQVFVLFGFDRKVSKESLIVRWIKKKRDHVDEILVGESQEEETQWTQYDEDQVTVKNEVTLSILDGLLEDTAQVVNAIFNNKMKKEKRNCIELSQ